MLSQERFEFAQLHHAQRLKDAAQQRLYISTRPVRVSLVARAIAFLYRRVAKPQFERYAAYQRGVQLN
jgi:hypothetical protein